MEGLEVVGMCEEKLLETQAYQRQVDDESIRSIERKSALEDAMSQQQIELLQHHVDELQERRLQEERGEEEIPDQQKYAHPTAVHCVEYLTYFLVPLSYCLVIVFSILIQGQIFQFWCLYDLCWRDQCYLSPS